MASMEEIIAQQKEQCIFCKIAKGEIPAIKVFEDDKILAIMDINPATDGHMLIFPKEHYPIAPLIPKDVYEHMVVIAKYLARAAKTALSKKNVSFFIANGGIAGQQSTHFMMHILPRDSELSFLEAKGSETPDVNIAKLLKERFLELFPEQKPGLPSELNKTKIAELFNTNHDFKELLLNNTDQLKELIASNPEWQELFSGIDVDALSNKLREIHNG